MRVRALHKLLVKLTPDVVVIKLKPMDMFKPFFVFEQNYDLANLFPRALRICFSLRKIGLSDSDLVNNRFPYTSDLFPVSDHILACPLSVLLNWFRCK